jgi:tellurite resistance protein
MDFNFVDADTQDFDPSTYLRILVAIAKADKDNGPPEFDYVRRQAERLGLESEEFLNNTEKTFLIGHQTVSRLTALVILKDAIALASLDGNLSLPERMKIYTYAESLDISRIDVDKLEKLLDAYRQLDGRWRQLVEEY